MKQLFFIIMILFSSAAMAENSSLNLALPGTSSAYGQDSFRAGELDCKNSIGGGTNFEFGVTGIIDNYASPFSSNRSSEDSSKDIGVYARVTIPLDGPAERVNCNTLYQLELKKKRLEVEKLERELEKLRALQATE
jgi:hypothetical protein